MVVTLSDGCIYLIESNAARNSDWITDHSGDPDAIDFATDNFNEGDDYIVISKFTDYNVMSHTGVPVKQTGGGYQYDVKLGKRYHTISFSGIVSSLAAANKVEQMIMAPEHTETTGFARYFLIIRFAASSYQNFTDNKGTQKEYCRCIIETGSIGWDADDPLIWTVSFNLKSVHKTT